MGPGCRSPFMSSGMKAWICASMPLKSLRINFTGETRHRLEHANSQPRGILIACRRWDRSQYPAFMGPSLGRWISRHFADEISNRAIPTKSFLERGIRWLQFGCPATLVYEPFWGFIGAVTRRTRSGQLLVPSEAVTMKEALRAYTYGAAFAAFEEEVKGSIEEGKYADLAVWEQNLYTVRPEPASLKTSKSS